MKLNKNILAFDLLIQTLIIGIALIATLAAAFSSSNIMFYLLCQMTMGFWQVLSALIIVAIAWDKKRIHYLIAVAAFFINTTLISHFWKDLVFESEIIMAFIWIAIPVVYANWYFNMTYDDYKNSEIETAAQNRSNEKFKRTWNEKELV